MWSRLARLPLRLRLTLVYALVLTAVLAVVGGVLFLRFEGALNRTIDADLRSRAQALAAIVAQQGPAAVGGRAGTPLLRPQEAFAQVLDARTGRIVAATPAVAALHPLDAAQLAAARRHGLLVTRTHLAGVAKRARFAAEPVPGGRGQVVVVGRSLKDREGANESFAAALLIGGPIALLLASGAGYGLAAAALRPVESMRRRAATISAAHAGERLPVPETDDEIARLGRTLNDMLARLEGAFAQQRALTGNASHELRTPLAVLVSTLEVTLRRERSREELEAALHDALVQAQRLAMLADALLVLAQADDGRLRLAYDEVDVDELALNVTQRFGDLAHARGRSVRAIPSGCRLTADPLRLEQVLDNLVDNALNHGEGAVTIEPEATDGGVTIHVRDEGAGLAGEFTAHAFERFTRGEAAGGRPGSGLGLSIVESIVAAHGGRVGAAEGPPGDVWVTLPSHA
jgi:signal transduction histidine kinase